MRERDLDNTVRTHREVLGLSQQALADRVGVSRQAVVAIEAGRQVPSTTLALSLAQVLGCGVEQLFRLSRPGGLDVVFAPDPPGRPGRVASRRVALGVVDGRWVAHALPVDATVAADGHVASIEAGPGEAGRVDPVRELEQLRRNTLVAGCAPLLGSLAQRVGRRFRDADMTWLPASSGRALSLLKAGLVHVAGIHRSDRSTGPEGHLELVRSMFPGERMLLVNLTRWHQGLVVAEGNPLDIRGGPDLASSRLRIAMREPGAGAHDVVQKLVASEGGSSAGLPAPTAFDHDEVARRVAYGVADTGVAVEGVAHTHGLGFVPIVEERFDLVVPAARAASPPVSRLLEALDHPGFRTDAGRLPGYDTASSGHTLTVEPV